MHDLDLDLYNGKRSYVNMTIESFNMNSDLTTIIFAISATIYAIFAIEISMTLTYP